MAEPICIIGDSITGGVVYLSDSAVHALEGLLCEPAGRLAGHGDEEPPSSVAPPALRSKRLERYPSDIAACPNTLSSCWAGTTRIFNWPAVAAEPEAPHDCKNTPMARFTEYQQRPGRHPGPSAAKPVVRINLIPRLRAALFRMVLAKVGPPRRSCAFGTTNSIEHWNVRCTNRRYANSCQARRPDAGRAQRLPSKSAILRAFQRGRHPPKPLEGTGECSITSCPRRRGYCLTSKSLRMQRRRLFFAPLSRGGAIFAARQFRGPSRGRCASSSGKDGEHLERPRRA